MFHYVTFLLDLAAERENRAIAETVRSRPDPARLPTTAFHWKVVCDAAGTVSIFGLVRGKSKLIAATTWSTAGLGALRQREPTVPTGPQWGFVAAALEAELAKRVASGEPADPTLLEPVSDVEGSYLSGADRASLDTTFRYNEPVRPPAAKPRGRTLPWIALGLGMIAVTIFVLVRRDRAKQTAVTAPAPTSVAASAPRSSSPPSAPAPPTDPPPTREAQIAAAPTFTAAIALAKSDPTGAALAYYPRLTWAEVDVPAETSIGHVQKDAEAERGKRMCAEGVIERIERRDLERRKLFVGRLRQADGDAVVFTALGTTGDLVKRSPAKFCGAVTGRDGDAAVLVGMFDLPENRTPLAEQ